MYVSAYLVCGLKTYVLDLELYIHDDKTRAAAVYVYVVVTDNGGIYCCHAFCWEVWIGSFR